MLVTFLGGKGVFSMTIPEGNNLKEERVILYHGFKVSVHSWLDPLLWAEGTQMAGLQEGVCGGGCSLHSSWEGGQGVEDGKGLRQGLFLHELSVATFLQVGAPIIPSYREPIMELIP